MKLETKKLIIAAMWVLTVCIAGVTAGIGSLLGWAMVAIVSVMPPLFLNQLWVAPAPTTSQSIREAIR